MDEQQVGPPPGASAGQIYGAAIRAYGRRFWTLFGLVALLDVPLTFLEFGLPVPQFSAAGEERLDVKAVTYVLALAAVALVVASFQHAAVSRLATSAAKGERSTVGSALAGTLRLGLPLLAAAVLAALATAGGLLLVVVPGIFLAVRLFFVPQVVVLEGFGGTNALRRAWGLSRGLGWWIFAVWVPAVLLTIGGTLLLTLPLRLSGDPIARLEGLGWVREAAFQGLARALTTPFLALVSLGLYLDARLRKEGVEPRDVAEGAP